MKSESSIHSRGPAKIYSAAGFCLALILPAFAAAAQSQTAPTPAIKLDQVGYLPKSVKLALVSAPAARFRVLRVQDGASVLEGKVSPAVSDRDSGDQVASVDFSALQAPGHYCLEIPGVGRSWSFQIGDEVYARTYYLGMRAFYGQRCGTAVDLGAEFPGYRYAACHLHGGFHPSTGKTGARDNIGGWHDAGDYGRYVVNSAISVANLMWAWEFYGDRIRKIPLQIPESGRAVPDLLAETRWNLEWMLKMQDEDGGVFHKQTSEAFPGFVAPDADGTLSYVIGTGAAPFKSTCASADLAASAAIAARVFQPYDAAFAAHSLQAAERAWTWALAHPRVAFKNPKGISTGEYGDDQCGDELLWAAAELWRSTGKVEYNRYFLTHWAAFNKALELGDNWKDVACMGLWTYALAKGGDATVIAAIRKQSVDAAQKIADRTLANAYHVSLRAQDYIWGSNSVAASYGILLLIADRFAPSAAFRAAAADNLHYLLGRNALSLSFVTQVGAHSFKHPHHRPSGALGRPWPGLLAGGPNAGRQDAALAKLPADLPPAKAYLDDQASYASNEIAINWQSAFVFLIASQLP